MRGKIKTLIFPAGNRKDFDELPDRIRKGLTPHFVHTSVTRLPQDLDDLANAGVSFVVIDTPPAITATIEGVVAVSDAVVIPTRPSPHDLRAAGATVELVERAGRSVIFVVNGAMPRARITSEAAIALSQHGTVAPVTMHQRTDFAASMIDGRTVMELNPESRSSQEVERLWTYLESRLARSRRLSRSSPASLEDAPPEALPAAAGMGGR